MNLHTPKSTSSLTALALLVLSATTITTTAYADQTTSYTYNSLGLIETVDGPRIDVNDISTFGYDTKGNRTTITNALGHVTQITAHDLSGRPLTIVDANGATTQLSYDVRGQLLSQDTAGRLTTFSYDGVGNVIQISQSNGQVITYTYDSAHRPTGYSDAQGNSVVYSLDLAGNQTDEKIYDPSNQLIRSHRFVYDELNRLRADIGAESQTATLSYDTNSNLINQSDPNGNPTSYAFDGLNRLIDTTDADNGQTTYGYDDSDNLTSVTDPNGNTTTYSYDAFDNLIQQNSPDTGISSYTYDEANNRTSQTDARGITTRYSYDALNRLIEVNHPTDYSGGLFDIRYRYDENNTNQHGIGRLTSQSDASGDTHYHYDIYGNTTHVTTERGNTVFSTQYNYNPSGQISSMVYPDGRTLNYQYDRAGRLSQLDTTDKQNNSQTLLSELHYAPFGPMLSQRFGNGLIADNTIDQDYRQANITTSSILERNYGFDLNSNIIHISNLLESNNNQDFHYDSLNRLANADNSHYGAINYQYDPTHNRISKHSLVNSLTINEDYQYAVDSNQLTQKTAGTIIHYQYDQNGNIIDNGRYRFIYSSANRIFIVHNQQHKLVAVYLYNAQGQRTAKIAQGWAYYIYNQQNQLIAETDRTGTVTKSYIYAHGELLAIVENEQLYYVHNDHLGTPQFITDQHQQIVWQAHYDPFGKATILVNTLENNIRFPGQYYDVETGLHYNYFRYYDPQTGRYITSDPIGLAGGLNTYGYVGGNPVNSTDSSGLLIDALADIGFIAYDLFRIAADNVFGSCNNLGGNLSALGADVGGLFIPGATGLGLGIRATKRTVNEAGVVREFTTKADQTFYRVFSGDNSVGGFVTAVKPKSSAFAREALALPRANRGNLVQEVLVPAGTRVRRSRAAPIRANETFPNRRGGAVQFELLDRIPTGNFGSGSSLR